MRFSVATWWQHKFFHNGDHHPEQDSSDNGTDNAADGLYDNEEPAQPSTTQLHEKVCCRL
jgi:hypothetical protein